MDTIRFHNLPSVLIFLSVCVIIHDWLIWQVNLWWSTHNPTQPRHPFSPLFTAFGVAYVCAGSAFIIPPVYSLIVFILFFIFGGIMGLLHLRRWWIRQSR